MSHNRVLPDDYAPEELIGVRQPMTQEEFEQLCHKHRKMRLELTSTGELIVIPPADLQTSRRSANLTSQLASWASDGNSGVCFGFLTLFALTNGARRSPYVAWVKREKWDSLTAEEKEGFARFCPDFVVEIWSPNIDLIQLYLKMVEYVENGVSLGWLLDPSKRQVYVYRPDKEVVILDNPETVSGDPLLPEFELNLTELWFE